MDNTSSVLAMTIYRHVSSRTEVGEWLRWEVMALRRHGYLTESICVEYDVMSSRQPALLLMQVLDLYIPLSSEIHFSHSLCSSSAGHPTFLPLFPH